MKKYAVIQVTLLALVFIAGCKKDSDPVNVLSEEFASVHLLTGADWKFVTNNSPNITAEWTQGTSRSGGKVPSGFDAHSYKDSPNEYAFVNGYYPGSTDSTDISSWMITPSIMVRNGDIIQFHTRSTNFTGSIDRLQILLNETGDSYDVGDSPESVGGFTRVLLDINASQTPEAFPGTWTMFSAPISGVTGAGRTRIAFRYLANGNTAFGVGVDALSIDRK